MVENNFSTPEVRLIRSQNLVVKKQVQWQWKKQNGAR